MPWYMRLKALLTPPCDECRHHGYYLARDVDCCLRFVITVPCESMRNSEFCRFERVEVDR